MPLPDEAFTFDDHNKVVLPGITTDHFGIRHYTTSTNGDWVNLEISRKDGGDILIDWYGSPQDLERLGVLLQYTAQQAIELQENGEQK